MTQKILSIMFLIVGVVLALSGFRGVKG